MAHPEQSPPQSRRKVLSPLMQAKADALGGEKVNFCPFGCELDKLDEHGYCDHLVGFTNDKKVYEPMVKVKGRRRVQPRMEKIGEEYDDFGKVQPVTRPVLEQCKDGDQFVQITTSFRVYRRYPGDKPKAAIALAEQK